MIEVLVNQRRRGSGPLHLPHTLFPRYPRCKPYGDPDNYERKEVEEDEDQEWCGRCFKAKESE